MLGSYKILTVTHRRTSLKNIGQFVMPHLDKADLQQRLEEFKAIMGLEELFYLSTCNRIIYFFVTNQPLDVAFQCRFFQYVNPNLTTSLLEQSLQAYEGEAALEHLYAVASSIDSLVVGEREILRQLREAYDECQAWGLTGDDIRLAIQYAVTAAKDVYSSTRIGEKPVSVVSLAIQKLLRANLHKHDRILLIGAGQTNALVAKFLVKHHFNNITVFNRSFDKAQQLANFVDGRAFPMEDLYSYTDGFDCIIVCTGSIQPIIDKSLYEQLVAGETSHKLIIDLAIPHNVAKDARQVPGLQYIEIEDLKLLAKENLAFREKEVQEVNTLLGKHLKEFPLHYKQRQLEKALHRVPSEIKAIKDHTLNTVFRKEVETLDDDTRQLVEKMLSYMEKKCIGIPMKAAREAAI